MEPVSDREIFVEFASKMKKTKQSFIIKRIATEGVTCSVNEDAVFKAFNVRIGNGSYVFDVQT
jgi:UDP-N-acetylmuramate--alanine ligase